MSKRVKFLIPGLYHKIAVCIVSQKWLGSFAKDKNILAYWEPEQGKVYVSKGLGPEVARHCFYHEIAHHIVDTLEAIKDDEAKCDLLGKYLADLGGEYNRIEKNLNQKTDKEE